ncbi:uncharacterized protein [Rhodnius prolixus]|uniref:Uncharacterized protein n=2 Tax=Rhodnius TaxID=13248 RepID=T1HUY4_RHOPR
MKLIILFALISYAFGDTGLVGDSTWDEIVDQAIDAARSDIIDNHYDIIHLPDIDETLHQKVLGINLTIPLKIEGAELWNISSVSRREPVTILQDDVSGNITILTSFGLDKFILNCSHLHFHVFALNVSGTMHAKCSSNELQFSISLITDKQDNCKAHINWARITKFQEFFLQLHPLNEANFFAQQILSFILNLFPKKAIDLINSDLTNKLNTFINNVDVCSYLPV